MFPVHVDRVSLQNDQKWESSFISWIEDLEERYVGVEDGFFVATVDPYIRLLQPQDEQQFVASLAENHLSTVSRQTLKKFKTEGLYHLAGHKAQENHFDLFKAETSKLQLYKEANCCVQILEEDNGLEKLFNHIGSDVICKHAVNVWGSHPARKTTSSKVLLEEAQLNLREEYEKFCDNSKDFTWELYKDPPPKRCPDVECAALSDSEESLFSTEDEGDSSEENLNKLTSERLNVPPIQAIKEEDAGYSHKLFYGHGLESCNKDIQITSNLNMSRIFNILWLVPEFYPGFHSTYFYFGRGHSMFPIHVEDSLCWSLNYLHIGHPKVWVIIPPWSTDLLDFHLHKAGLSLLHSTCRNLLGHKILIPTLDWLKQRRIPFKIVIQRQGDMVILRPNTPHFGFNLGHNIAQAVNIGSKSWIPWGLNAKKCTCMRKQIHLNLVPLVSAFRKDLLPTVLNGGVVMTPEILRGLQFLSDELNQFYNEKKALKRKPSEKQIGGGMKRIKSPANEQYPHESETIQCPASNCKLAVPKFPLESSKVNLKRHINQAHKPILKEFNLLQKVDELFN